MNTNKDNVCIIRKNILKKEQISKEALEKLNKNELIDLVLTLIQDFQPILKVN